MLSEPYIWCLKCGAHMKKRVGKLAVKCRNAPRSRWGHTCRRRLMEGKDPVTGEALVDAQPRRLTAEELCCWRDR